MTEESEARFAVFCELREIDRPLYLHNLTFARLLDEVVVPLERNEPFFVDGALVKKTDIRRLKILKQGPAFRKGFYGLHGSLHERKGSDSRILGEQYHVRLEAVFRETCEDVTSQAIKAFNTEIKPRLKEYLPNKKELLEAATRVFIEGLKLLD